MLDGGYSGFYFILFLLNSSNEFQKCVIKDIKVPLYIKWP